MTRIRSVYVIQNKLNDKVYIGQTVDPYIRFSAHRSELKYGKHRNCHLQNAWWKYGPEAFDLFVLDEYDSRESVDEAEIFYIAWYRELDLCYNLESGGYNPTVSPESIEKTRKKITGLKRSEETKKRMSLASQGRTLSPETRKKIGEKSRLKTFSPETRLKMSLANSGRSLSPYQKQRMQEGLERYRQRRREEKATLAALTPPEDKQPYVPWNRGKKLGSYPRERVEKATRSRLETIQRNGGLGPAWNRGVPNTPEQKEKISQSLKETWRLRKEAQIPWKKSSSVTEDDSP